MTFLSNVTFAATKILSSLKAEIHVALRASLNLEHAMLPAKYLSLQREHLELPESVNSWN